MMRTDHWRILTVLCVFVLGWALLAQASTLPAKSASPVTRAPASMAPSSHSGGSSLDEVIYTESWEGGTLDGWTPTDLTTFAPVCWHLDDNNAFGGSGTSWWMADTTINGYDNAWMQALDSPPITLPAGTPALRFFHRYSVEDPAGASEGFTGWDGMNLRISTDNGSTWTIIGNAALTPDYDVTSLYSFGFSHGEGYDVPGWAGENATWHLQTADLTAWAGQTVKLRWVFASDPGESTVDDPNLWGWMIDAIRVYAGTDTVFTSDAGDATGWTPQNLIPVAGNLWRVATDATSPAGPHVLATNDPQTGRYARYMNTVLVSPLIDISQYTEGTLTVDFVVRGTVMGQTDLGSDYWGLQVSSDTGRTWCYISNPTCDPNGTNYVYVDAPDAWTLFSAGYGDGELFDLSDLLGTTPTLQFRFTFQSTGDTSLAEGPFFDNFQLDYQEGFPNDYSTYSVQVRYPNVAGRAFRVSAYFRNEGTSASNDVQTWWKHSGMAGWAPYVGRLSLAPEEEGRRDATVIIDDPDVYTFYARTALGTDENTGNDVDTAYNVEVLPASSTLEIGYDNRTARYRYNFPTNAGPMVHFTPTADSVIMDAYNVSMLRVLFDEQPGDYNIQLHVYEDADTAAGAEIYTATVTVLQTETTTGWKEIDLSAVPELQARTDGFWVWLEILDTAPEDRWPQVVGANAEPWDDIHFYDKVDEAEAVASDEFYLIHAVIDDISSVRDVTTTVPQSWSLGQNYPNPFNPATEIQFSVPRAEWVSLTVYNLMGQKVATLHDGMTQPGTYAASFRGANLATGVYIYRLEAPSFTETRKMLMMK